MSVTHDAEGKVPPGLFRRGGRYSIRRRVPKDLLEHFGKAEIVYALGTADPQLARERWAVEWVKLDRQFKALREKRRGPPRASGATCKASHLQPWPANVSLSQFEDWLDGDADQQKEMAAEEAAYESRADIRKATTDALAGPVEALTPQQSAVRDLLQDSAFSEAVANERLMALQMRQGPPAPKADLAPSGQSRAPEGIGLEAVWQRWAAERAPKPRAIKAHHRVVQQFEAMCGRIAVLDITRMHAIEFKNALIAAGKTPENTNVLLTRLRTLLNFAEENGLTPIRAATGVRAIDNRRRKGRRREWDAEALGKLLAGPVHAEHERPSAGGGEAAYWLPLLALFTGARQTELGQLHPDDVDLEHYVEADGSEHSAWVIRIVENLDRQQHVKNSGSERRIPVHADLIALGFLDIAQQARTEGRSRIFPDIRAAGDELMANWSKWFTRYRRAVGVTSADTPFHAFRNSFKHYARLSGVDRQASHEITGHDSGDVGDEVYVGLSYPLAPLVKAISCYRVPGIVLPPLSPKVRELRGRLSAVG